MEAARRWAAGRPTHPWNWSYSPPVARPPHLISTSEGSSSGAFTALDWSLLALTALTWGSAYILIEVGLHTVPPGGVAFLRVLLALLLLAAVPAARRARLDGQDRPRLAFLGFLWLGLPLLLFPVAQQSISSSTAGVLTGAQPLFAAVIAALLLRRAPRPIQITGLVLGFGGVVAIASASAGSGRSALSGVIIVLIAVLCYALSTNLAVPLQQRYGALPVIFWALGAAAIVLSPVGIWGLLHSSPDAGSLAAIGVLGIFSTGISYVAFTRLLGRVGAARGAVTVYFVPVVAIVLGATLAGDRVVPLELVGAALVLVGAVLTGRAAHSPAVAK